MRTPAAKGYNETYNEFDKLNENILYIIEYNL